MAIYIPSVTIAVQMIVKAYVDDDYSRMKETMDYVVNTPSIAGSADEYHNAAVQLVQIEDYDSAIILLEHGLTRYPRSTDILADLLEYGLKCRKVPEISPYYFERLSKINKKFWTWRAFHFSIDFLMEYIQYSDTEEQEATIATEIEGLIKLYKEYKPSDERAYMIEHEYYALMNEGQKAINALKTAVKTLEVCPQCALKYGDTLFQDGKYSEAIPVLEKAVNIRQDQPSISLGYAYYIMALSKEFVLRDSNATISPNNVKSVYDAYFAAIQFLGADNRQRLFNQIEMRVKVLERESGVQSEISFSMASDNMSDILKQWLLSKDVSQAKFSSQETN